MLGLVAEIPCEKCGHQESEIMGVKASFHEEAGGKLTHESTLYQLKCTATHCGHRFELLVLLDQANSEA